MGRRTSKWGYLKQIINRQFVEFTYKEVADKALKLASALEALGAEPTIESRLFLKLCGMVYHDLAGECWEILSASQFFPTAGADYHQYCIESTVRNKIVIAGKLWMT